MFSFEKKGNIDPMGKTFPWGLKDDFGDYLFGFFIIPPNEQQDKTEGSNDQSKNGITGDARHGYLHQSKKLAKTKKSNAHANRIGSALSKWQAMAPPTPIKCRSSTN